MSRHAAVDDWRLSLCRRESGGYWVRRRDTGRALGVIELARSRWRWASWRGAFRGDGRPGCECDGDATWPVPPSLGAQGDARTQLDACTALVEYLVGVRAPVLGFGPHPEVTAPGQREVAGHGVR